MKINSLIWEILRKIQQFVVACLHCQALRLAAGLTVLNS